MIQKTENIIVRNLSLVKYDGPFVYLISCQYRCDEWPEQIWSDFKHIFTSFKQIGYNDIKIVDAIRQFVLPNIDRRSHERTKL